MSLDWVPVVIIGGFYLGMAAIYATAAFEVLRLLRDLIRWLVSRL